MTKNVDSNQQRSQPDSCIASADESTMNRNSILVAAKIRWSALLKRADAKEIQRHPLRCIDEHFRAIFDYCAVAKAILTIAFFFARLRSFRSQTLFGMATFAPADRCVTDACHIRVAGETSQRTAQHVGDQQQDYERVHKFQDSSRHC